jgi:hypothetical protein
MGVKLYSFTPKFGVDGTDHQPELQRYVIINIKSKFIFKC